ncbi:hypothetical protein NP493_582g02029 [Ridgeia piscesae]|uniref:MKRN2 opposite strand protein n=1 Tax=Ridgeia piscesae TaxID=27915 RepID=A0AAD9KUU0_RIDPI|nr:hypothetical protein NP493_582g02029 [Ridgeia piscesae]
MANDPIMCFHHCQTDASLLCLSLPPVCPLCEGEVYTTPMKVPPFRLPSPFLHSTEAPYCVVLRPTHGTFLEDYSNAANLHVGVTNSRGAVYDYNEKGVNRSLEGWDQCVCVPVLQQYDEKCIALWDQKLEQHSAYNTWHPERYSQTDNNCYDFVLGFLRLLELQDTIPAIASRPEFCDQFIVPKTTEAARYISLYRKLRQEYVTVQYNTAL